VAASRATPLRRVGPAVGEKRGFRTRDRYRRDADLEGESSFWHPTSSSIALVVSWIIFMSSEEPRKQPWSARLGRLVRLGRSPLVLGWKAASLTSGKYALAVRVPTSLTVALGCDEQVRAHRV
jgi:hypothetical protein